MNDIRLAATAQPFDVTVFDLDRIDIKSIPTTLLNDQLMRSHRCVPLFHHRNQLYVATDNPNQHDALNEIQFHTGLHVIPLVVETHKLTRLINKLLNQQENQCLADYAAESLDDVEHTPDESVDDKPVVKFIKRIILHAIEQGASDIHFEPYEHDYRIRYRQDGLLVTAASPPPALSARITVRLKVLANLDISERRIPQDGRFGMRISPTLSVDFRVSTCPTVNGEKIVMRILDTNLTSPDIDTLGFMPQQKAHFLYAIDRAQGMVLVTGPTGSGKTMTLYSALTILNTGKKNVSTVEDPVEISVHGINQVNINAKAGLTFVRTLRAFLRQDPDVIMIGEIRDLETAEIAIKAAQTGHLVLSTLHTNSAAETLTRLLNLGVPAFNIASSVSLIVAQRLIRCLCNTCKILRLDRAAFSLINRGLSEVDAKTHESYQAQGCNQCTDGYRGRMALFEVMPISRNIASMIMAGTNSLDLLKQAQAEGMITIFQTGLEKVKMGLTSIEELHRVTVD